MEVRRTVKFARIGFLAGGESKSQMRHGYDIFRLTNMQNKEDGMESKVSQTGNENYKTQKG